MDNDDKILEQIVEKNGLPKVYFEEVVRSNEDEDYETFHFKIGSIKQPKSKWYNPFSWFNRSIILEDCEFVDMRNTSDE